MNTDCNKCCSLTLNVVPVNKVVYFCLRMPAFKLRATGIATDKMDYK